MELRHLNPSYEVGGFVYEVIEYDDFAKLIKIFGKAKSREDFEKILEEKGIKVNKYKRL